MPSHTSLYKIYTEQWQLVSRAVAKGEALAKELGVEQGDLRGMAAQLTPEEFAQAVVENNAAWTAKGQDVHSERARTAATKAGFMDNNLLHEFGTLTGGQSWTCTRKECLKDSHSRPTVLKHIRQHHPDKPATSESYTVLGKDRYICKWCSDMLKPFHTNRTQNFQSHCNMYHQGNFKC